mmetsp:Transcript_14241/g.21373  ORF Transcript_14241/g.21373 Transcript_14241/m.21373 type:complete len:80 (-) Transcript_14241:1399-1638(-)
MCGVSFPAYSDRRSNEVVHTEKASAHPSDQHFAGSKFYITSLIIVMHFIQNLLQGMQHGSNLRSLIQQPCLPNPPQELD